MKSTGICTKCKSASVVRLKAFQGTSTSNVIHLSKWGTQMAFFDRYLCSSCGFIEHYADLNDKRWQKWLQKKAETNDLDSDFV